VETQSVNIRTGVASGLLFALVVALLAACGNAAGGPTAGTTIVKGLVVLSPSSPVCRIGSPCSKPLPHFPLVFARSGKTVARVKTDAHARYRVALVPGRYAVSTTRRGALRPRRVRIRATASARVNFSFDAGIR
jgi:hypothetical protein